MRFTAHTPRKSSNKRCFAAAKIAYQLNDFTPL